MVNLRPNNEAQTKDEEEINMDNIWCRLLKDDGKYHYVYVPYMMALALCMKQGYEINVLPEEVPDKVKREYNQ
jgi:hypothetical protein